MGKYTLIGIICSMLLGMGFSMTTEDTEINESLLDLLDNENPNFDALLSEAKKYGLLDTGQYETPVYIDRKDNLCLNVKLMKGNDTKLAINKEIQRLYVQVPSKYIFPTNEEMIKSLATVFNISRDCLHVKDSFADRRILVVSSHLSSSDMVDTIVAVSIGNMLSEDGKTICSVNTDELKKFIRDKRITLPPDLHKIKGIDQGDVERLAKVLGIEPPPGVVTRKTTEKSKRIESVLTQKVSIREESPEQINEKSKLDYMNTETVSRNATMEVKKTLEILPTKTHTAAVKNIAAESSSKLRNTVKQKMVAKKGKGKTKSEVLTRKLKKTKTIESHVTQKVNIREDSAEQIKERSEYEKLNTDAETMERKQSHAKTVKNKVTKDRLKLKKTVKSKVGTKKEKRKTKSGVGKTKSKTKTKGKVKKTKETKSKSKTGRMPKTTKAKIKTKTRTKKVKPKIKKEISPKYIPVLHDDHDNVVIRVKVTRGNSNKLLKVEYKSETTLATVDVQVQAPMYQEAFENEMSRYMSQVLGVSRKHIKLHIDKNQNIKKVEIPKQKLEIEVARQKLKDAFNGMHEFSLIQ